MPPGRPPKYTPSLASALLDLISNGKSLRKACKEPGMPSRDVVNNWLRDNSVFQDQYARACQERADALVDEAYDIIDDASADYTFDEDGVPRVNHENINRSRARMDLRKWHAARMAPKKYGDRIMQEHSGPDGGPMQHQIAVDAPPQETREQWEQRKLLEREAEKLSTDPVVIKLIAS